MPFEIRTYDHGQMLMLSGRLGVQQARPLWDAMEAASALHGVLLLQAEAVEEIDTSIAQVLCRSLHQGHLQVGSASDGLQASLQRRGLGDILIQPLNPSKTARQPSPSQALSEPIKTGKRRTPRSSNKPAAGSVRNG